MKFNNLIKSWNKFKIWNYSFCLKYKLNDKSYMYILLFYILYFHLIIADLKRFKF